MLALLDGILLDERDWDTLVGVAGWAGDRWIGIRWRCVTGGRQLGERRMGGFGTLWLCWTGDSWKSAKWRCWTGVRVLVWDTGRVLDWDTVALLDG